ncbi:YhgE/Pip domain-containing protein [Leucobacter viscericola]|uniref:YhgE/Pip domain-containing protein n=1 Tax=Leucobacter viscericola TaxID=2714935 RepID=A0A6G7XJ13_9MICO|nr:YhgE/Pip domain-containing protein [Leucobacter viscericola]QIK64476.1 YhgE/Pip domain-containing protein [Leucobacter viscericola]
MIAAFSPGSDFKRYYRGRMPRLAFIVILLMPLMYGALYLWAFWNPFGNVDKIPVAIINLDTGTQIKGEQLDAGKQVVKGLVDSKQLDLHETSEKDGVDGLAHGKYYFTITLPKDFSESIASAATDSPRSAELQFTYNDSNNYLSTVIGQDAAEEVINQVSAQVGEQTFDMVLTGVKGAIPKIKAAVGSVDELNTGMQAANDGAHELATNLVTANDGAATLAGAIDELDDAVNSATSRADAAIAKSGLTGNEIRSIVGSIGANTDAVAGAMDRAVAAQTEANADLQSVINDLNVSGDPAQQAIATRLVTVQSKFENASLTKEVTASFDQIHSDVDRLAAEINNPDSRVNVILRSVENGAVQRDLATVTSKAGELRSGADQLSDGLVKLTDGAQTLAAGTTQLAAGTDELQSGANLGLKLLPSWNDSQQSNFINTLAQPVKLHETVNNEAKTFAYGFAPFFLGLALFVGGIIAWMLFTPVLARPLAQGLSSFRVVLASYAPTFFVGLLQATILFLVVYLAIGLHPVHVWGTFGFMVLMVAMFLAMIQMFNALLGPAVGRVLTLAFLMVQLTSAGGIYPVPTTTPLFQHINPFDPMTYTNTGLRQLILGGVDYRLGTAIAVMVGLTVIFIAVSTWAARRNRQYNMDRLYPPVEV